MNRPPSPLPGYRLGIMRRTALLSWLVALFTLLLFVLVLMPQQRQTFLESLRSKANGVTVSLREVATGAVVNEDYSSVVDHCTEMLKGDPAIDFIVLTRSDGFSLVHDRNGWYSKTLGPEWHPARRETTFGISTPPLFQRRVYAYSQPFDYSGIEWGWIHIGLSLDSYDRSVANVYRRTAWLSIACILVSLGGSVLYARHLVRPIVSLQQLVQRIAAGDLSIRADVERTDELGQLARSVNTMTDALLRRDRTLKEANESLESRVRERTRELQEQVTAKENALAELAATQQRLIEFSRQAGMAQIATGVLHNVGNVLNSVNISTNLLRDQLTANAQMALFKQTAALLREQGAGLTRFLDEDPRGRMVVPLVLQIATELEGNFELMGRELTQLSQNVDHIKQIVAAQQSYAKAGGVHQTFDPSELFADTLRICHASTVRHGVVVATDYQAGRQQITTDRHLSLQILVNLVNNGIQALKPQPTGQRRLTLRITQDQERVSFSVTDNGIGIDPANRQKLFQHGFTTRKDGHGFGLHSGALAALNLGGALDVASDGLGRGACFTLHLPLTPPPARAND